VRYLLDTNAISDFVRDQAMVAKHLKATRPDEIAVSTVTLMEIEYGLALEPVRARRIAPLLDGLLASVRVLPFSRVDARSAGVVRAALRRHGRPIGPYDILLAGCALARGLTLVTANTGEFSRVAGLAIEDWRVG
jgi:tRNA(fMet)-specific endonuclease VapC